jgi:hypothetical protein
MEKKMRSIKLERSKGKIKREIKEKELKGKRKK